MNKKIRLRFAPSPTGGLHLGGVRTVLYNYLFARQHQGDFILRIEDTDQNRYVSGAEEYIYECLNWCGLEPDESPIKKGLFGPYRQSERKEIYRQYADQLVKNEYAYYAFDTPEELEKMRHNYTTEENPSPQYDHNVRMQMQNSLSLTKSESNDLITSGIPYVIRIKVPTNETVSFNDMIRGEVSFETSLIDDKVLLKADGMPTYHLAVVVDDYLMKISHAFRGEEWLPSAPVHILLWKYLGWEQEMPHWAHLPLIMGPHGKLSKRDSALYGFPVFAMNWRDPKTMDFVEGFREKGFLPEGFINMLAMLGWNDGTEQEIFTMDELIQKFSIERVHKGGAKFDYEKAKWYNHEWIKKLPAKNYQPTVKSILISNNIDVKDDKLLEDAIELVKDRCHLLTDFTDQTRFFFQAPGEYDSGAVKPKWNDDKKTFFECLIRELEAMNTWESAFLEEGFKKIATENNIKPGELQLPFRIFLVGGKFGPPVFKIAEVLGKKETIDRIRKAMEHGF